MNFSDYEEEAAKTAIYPRQHRLIYPVLGLTGEAGEVSEKVKKILRDKAGVATEQDIESLVKELGDVLWYLTAIAHDLGVGLDTVARVNIEKLRDRSRRDAIKGSGDER